MLPNSIHALKVTLQCNNTAAAMTAHTVTHLGHLYDSLSSWLHSCFTATQSYSSKMSIYHALLRLTPQCIQFCS